MKPTTQDKSAQQQNTSQTIVAQTIAPPAIILNTSTHRITLSPGQRCSICTCGHSKALPFCDDSHRQLNAEKGTSYRSLKIAYAGEYSGEDSARIKSSGKGPSREKVTLEVYSANWP